jgi:hypothetical protein
MTTDIARDEIGDWNDGSVFVPTLFVRPRPNTRQSGAGC